MLRILNGSALSSKQDKLIDFMKKSYENGSSIIVIVPDQISFEYDKKLFKAFGPKAFNDLKVISFKRLSEELIKKYGNSRGPRIDENARLIMMAQALKGLKKDENIKYYNRSLDKSGFVVSMTDFVKELKSSGVTPQSLKESSEKLTGMLADKLNDLAIISAKYNETLDKYSLVDGLDDIEEGAKIAKEQGFFEGYDVFVDEFNSFSWEEYCVLEAIIKDAKSLSIALNISNFENSKSKLTPFLPCIRTGNRLVNLAKAYNKRVEFFEFDDLEKCKSENIKHLNKFLFSKSPVKTKADNTVRCIRAGDFYEEIEFVGSEIRRLVCDEGYRYSDFAIISRTAEEYSEVIDTFFEKYEIPYFFDAHKNVSQSAVVMYVLSCLEVAITKKYNTENILRCIKSRFSNLDQIDSGKLEDYCFKWSVNGDMWLEDFTASDSRNGKESYLADLNRIRRMIIDPFERLKEKTKNSTAKEVCIAFNDFLDEIKFPEKAYGVSAEAVNSGEPEIARELKQLWKILLSSINSIYENIGDEEMSLKSFYELVKLIMFNSKVSSPPERLDSVTVASAERSRLSSPKVVFVIGANDGFFPYAVKENGFFTSREKETLLDEGISISKNLGEMIEDERLITFLSLTYPSEKLYVSFSNSDLKGGVRRRSVLVNQLLAMLDGLVLENTYDKPKTFYSKTYSSAYQKCIESIRNKSAEINSIREAVSKKEEYKEKLRYVEDMLKRDYHHLDSTLSQKMFFEKHTDISATKIESYYNCPYSFFLKYGLKLKTNSKVEINPLNRGSIMHYCFEKLMCKNSDGVGEAYNDEFEKLSESELYNLIKKLVFEYKENELGGEFGKTKRFDEGLRRIVDTVFEIALNMRSEFSKSKFRPEAFEYNISDDKGALDISFGNGLKFSLVGKIDRVDTYYDGDEKYLRVIDYKTGGKALNLSELYNGLNLQMILYLLATIKREESKFHGFTPAGILYMNAVELECKMDRKDIYSSQELEKEIEKTKLKEFSRDGIVLDDKKIVEAMDEEFSGVYAPVTLNRDGSFSKTSRVADSDYLTALQNFAESKVSELGLSLVSGKIEALPLDIGRLPCGFCDFWSVCGNYNTGIKRVINKDDGEKLRKILSGEEKKEA